MSKKGQRIFKSASLVTLGLIAGIMIIQLSLAIPVAGQQARPAVNSGTPDLDETIPQGAFVRVAEETQQALVYIMAEHSVDTAEMFGGRFFSPDNENEDAPDIPDQVQPAQGSGFLISSSGYIVTNGHVVSRTDTNAVEVIRADSVTVRLSNEDEYPAEIVGVDIGTDLAVLKIDVGTDLPYIPLGDSDVARVGEWVMALGAPFGLTNTVSAGIVSAKGRARIGGLNGSAYQDFIQTDAAINQGNSGGPLFNMDGEVIGVNTAIYSMTGASVGIAFAIPSAIAGNIATQLEEFGEVKRGWLGVEIHLVTEDIAMSIGLKNPRGALVASTVDSGPAEKAGIVSGDVILVFDGKDIESFKDLPRVVADTKPGSEVSVKIWRGNRVQEFNVFLGTKGQLSKGVTDSPLEGE